MNKDFENLHTYDMKKRFIAVLLAATACACAFAGCGARENTTQKAREPDVTIKREIPDARRDFDGIFPVPPEHGIARPAPLPAPHKKGGIRLK